MIEMDEAIIIDIDGTLSNCEHRRHFVQNKPKNWKAFYDGLLEDYPNRWCIHIMETLFMRGFKILLVSGRPDNYREKTIEWFRRNLIVFNALFMRKEGDNRQDYIVKKEIYEEHIKDKYKILFVIDDRKQVVDMWREQGLVCLQCAEGDF